MECSIWHTVGALCRWYPRGLSNGHVLVPEFKDELDILGSTRSSVFALGEMSKQLK